MTTKSLTDCYGRRLTVENGRPGIHVHASETVGPFTSEQLRTALDEVAPAGSYTRTDEEGTDTRTREHLLAEEERLRKLEESLRAHLSRTINRAEKAEKERDEADTANAGLQAEVDRWKARAEQPRPLTADNLSDEAIRRARVAWLENAQGEGCPSAPTIRAMFAAALTEPTRSKRAEAIEAIIADQIGGDVGPATIRDLADRIATEVQP